ncbi:MAG TPA: S9 family peptidase [Acidimicrobiales bacterium]|jgi:oligopeptidase B
MPTPPLAEQRPQTLTAHGDERQDPWYWLRQRDDPAVTEYLEAENAYTEAALGHLGSLRDELFEEMKARIKETDMSVPSRRGPWWYYSRTEEGHSYGIHCRRPGGPADELPPAGEAGAQEQILLDENIEAEGHAYFAVGSAAVSPDHRWLAYSTDTEGNEIYTLRFRPLDGAPADAAPESIEQTSYGLAWSSDASHIFYVRIDEALRPYQLWRHRLGGDPGQDVMVYEESDRRFYLQTGVTRDEALVVISLSSTNTSECLTIPANAPETAFEPVIPRREGLEYAVDHLPAAEGEWLLAVINDQGPDFRLIATPDGASLPLSEWREIVPFRPGVRIEDVDAFRTVLVLSERAEAETRVRVLPLQAGPDPFGRDPLAGSWLMAAPESPASTWVSANAEPDITALRITRTSMVSPTSVLQVDLETRSETVLKQEPVLGQFSRGDYVTSRQWATAADGTQIPISLVHRRDTVLPAPCLLYGYGAYEISIDPSFSHHRLSLLDRGVAFAIAHIRGGGEMGRAWYEGGRMEHKTNTFGDFIACAHHLIDHGTARPGVVAGRGGSAGGLLIGAVANMAPELFSALVAQVPFVDVVTTMLDDQLPLTVGEWEEWGNPLADGSAYWRMLGYSPYDNVAAQNPDGSSRTYPRLLITGGLDDPRVAYWEPAKWVAKLRVVAPQTSVYLKTEMGAGHGGPSGRYDSWKEEALVIAFLLDAFGLAPAR